ncbi:hypothetical protein [Sphingobium sp. Ant17]|uniref:hypothetical protein n=1 Tax=Sphingobium sp. Ant17 TaxID=1461752 RepID=UPI0004462C9D|nr:hypothetical protein [Sphingobium sp. Ant17]EXS71530.1 hypothetical protein BF95_05390 [Sphingobium sp. Ant17]
MDAANNRAPTTDDARPKLPSPMIQFERLFTRRNGSSCDGLILPQIFPSQKYPYIEIDVQHMELTGVNEAAGQAAHWLNAQHYVH